MGCDVWPKRRRETEIINFLDRSRLWNQGCNGIVREIFRYQETKRGGSVFHRDCYRFLMAILSLVQKSDHGILILEGHLRDAVDFANLSANSFPAIPPWPGTHRNWISKPVSVREYRRCLILIIRDEDWELNTLEKRTWRVESESVMTRNLFGYKDKIV